MTQNTSKTPRRFDWFTGMTFTSRQARYSARNKIEGKCANCPKKARLGASICRQCAKKKRVINRRAWAKRYNNPAFRSSYLKKRQLAYQHYRRLGYSGREATKFSGRGIDRSVGPAPPQIPVWKEPKPKIIKIWRDGEWIDGYELGPDDRPEGPLPP